MKGKQDEEKVRRSLVVPFLIAILAVSVTLVVTPHRELDWDGTVVPLAQKYYGTGRTTTPLDGKIVVITGVTSGIGLSLTKAMTKLGATVVGIGRNPKKLEAVQKDVQTLQPFVADLKDLSSVSAAADRILAKFESIDILINNAGVHDGSTNFRGDKVSAQGYDQAFSVNFLSHFLLVEKLSDALLKSPKPTILQIASVLHYEVDGSDLVPQQGSEIPLAAQKGGNPGFLVRSSRSYANSKLAQILHARALKRNHPLWKAASNARVVSVCPGVVATDIAPGKIGRNIMSRGFPVDGWGIATPLIGMFSEEADGDFFSSATSMQIIRAMDYLGSPWMYSLKLRDFAFAFLGLWVLFPFQHTTARVAPQPSSAVSYNMTIGDDLYMWSSKAIGDFL